MGIMAITDADNAGAPPGVAPLFIGFVVTLIGISFGMMSGYAVNPARDLGPRLFTAIAGWGAEVFTLV
jgi:glycerol uptake facilitator-like aquaporin